ncbi:MAG: DUF4412 domain-containing protein [Kiritimatiellia bacterium]|nr:DUF4412 domain-containing protein [Lentisphaerota bacterium]
MFNISRMAVLAAISAVCLAGRADDLMLEQTVEIGGMPGQAPISMAQKIWLSPGKMRMEMRGATGLPGMGDMLMIMRSDQQKIYMVNEGTRSYMEMPMEQSAGLQGMEGMEFELEATGQSKKIKEWDCREYVMTLSGGSVATRSVMWVTEDIQLDDKLRDGLFELAGKNPMMRPLMQKMRELKGFPVEQTVEIDMGGMKMVTSSRVTAVKREKVADEMFMPPEGYTMTEMPL